MLELKNISKKFKDRQILSDFNLTVEENKILAIVGPSGGGKTTLLRMLAGLEKIDSGEIIYNGESLPIDELEKRKLLGFVFQDFQLFPHLTVLENLVLSPIKTMNMAKNDAENKAIKLLEKLGLEKQINNYPTSLSGGQKQRIAIAGAVAMRPDCIVFDEPTAMLDPKGRSQVMKVIRELNDQGITIILITHFMEEVAEADRVLVMKSGKLLADSVPEDVFADTNLIESAGLEIPAAVLLRNELIENEISLSHEVINKDDLVDALCR